jgi:integrase
MFKPTQLPSGSWRIRWIDENGKRHSATFQNYKEAVYQFGLRNAEVTEIERGLRSPTPEPKTFSELCDKYLTNRTSQKRRRQDDESMIRVHLRPAFGPLFLNSINVDHLDQYKLSKKHLQPKTVHHQLTLFVTMMNYAHEMRWLREPLKVKKPRIVLFDKDFRYLRTKEEIDRLLRSAWEEGELVHALYSTAVFTGMREGELAGLKWSCVDFERRLITVQHSYDGPTKTEDVRYVPILDPLLPIIQKWRLRNPIEWVFPNENGNMQGPSARIFQEVFHRVLDRAGFPKAERYGKTLRYIVFHDLRHTFASHWVMSGGLIEKLRRILGHKTVQMTTRYAHLSPEAYNSDFGRLGEFHTIPSESSVIPLRSSKSSADF